jgi:UDP-N-acetylglucosamine transferase subunit ALG13
MSQRKNILLSPLNWGLGHTTRLWALVMQLRQENFKFFWAVSGKPEQWIKLQLHQNQFDDEIIPTTAFAMKHHGRLLSFALQMPSFLYHIRKDREWTKSVIEEHKINALISDHNFGAYSEKIPSILIAHQLWLPVFDKNKVLNSLANQFHTKYLKDYTQIWIPDVEGKNSISGKLSVNKALESQTLRIGLLSHLNETEENINAVNDFFELVGIVSGPEPFRRKFADKLLHFLKSTHKKSVIIGGDFSKEAIASQNENVKLISAVGTEMKSMIKQAKIVIASGGYSTLMDLKLMKKQAILIPMPGQPEQQYLAQYLSKDPDFRFVQMDELEQVDLKDLHFEQSSNSITDDTSQKELILQKLIDMLGS